VRALVCIKFVPDLDMVILSDWNAYSSMDHFDIGYVKNIKNPFDESALEMALRLADGVRNVGLTFDTTVLSIGKKDIERDLKNLYAIGVDNIYRIEDANIEDSVAAAFAIKSAAECLGPFDIIFLGEQAGVSDSGQTGFIVAEMLRIPCVSRVTFISKTASGLRLAHETDGGCETLHIRLPVVLTVGNVKNMQLRIPTIKEKLRTKGQEVTILDMPQQPTKHMMPQAVYFRKKPDRQNVIVKYTRDTEKIKWLVENIAHITYGKT
jgi:electron transfer flavoprotein beta subunit